MNTALHGWLTVTHGDQPLVLSIPHSGIDLPEDIAADVVSPWLARKDTDWWVHRLYGFAAELGATVVRTGISRTVIDVNRNPFGVSLYPGQTTTELCPTTTFDGEPLYRTGRTPDAAQIEARRKQYFDPYHLALQKEIGRLRDRHGTIVVYEAHSIRSVVPRLFDSALPNFNIGTNDGKSCHPTLTSSVEAVCAGTAFSRVTNGRFKGGYTTRHYGDPAQGVHAIQMELACRGYLPEPAGAVHPDNWPAPYDESRAAPMRATLEQILHTCIEFARTHA